MYIYRRAYYGSKIEAGGHQVSTGLRDGSVWISGIHRYADVYVCVYVCMCFLNSVYIYVYTHEHMYSSKCLRASTMPQYEFRVRGGEES